MIDEIVRQATRTFYASAPWSTVTSATAMTPSDSRRAELLEQRAALESYLLSKVRAKDWHAVQDAGSDIREIDARLDELGRT